MKKAEHIPPIASFLSRGHDVVLPKDTLMEIGFGPPDTAASQGKSQ